MEANVSKHYYLTVSSLLGFGVLILCLYFVLSNNQVHYNTIPEETRYQFKEVDHPIQPIPTLQHIDLRWVRLGKALFHSPLLSKDNSVSCASCHMVDFGGDDGFSLSTGVANNIGTRNSPTVLNAAFNFRQFWDGRSATLEDQVEGPIHNPVEMATNWPQVIEKLMNDKLFKQAFADLGIDVIEPSQIVKAITTYEESLITPDSPIDQYLLGNASALSPLQIKGLNKFENFGCITCHQGVNIGGNLYQKLGRLNELPTNLKYDLGRYEITKNPLDKHVFKVPSLRNILKTAPYFHDGSIETIEEAITIMAEKQLGREISDQDIAELVALFQSFSAPLIEVEKQ